MNDKLTVTAKMTTKNQITIPKTVRDFLNLHDQDTIIFEIGTDGIVRLKPQKKIDFWGMVKEQEAIYGNVSTPEIDWGTDVELEDIDE